jgi:hypothetical protein
VIGHRQFQFLRAGKSRQSHFRSHSARDLSSGLSGYKFPQAGSYGCARIATAIFQFRSGKIRLMRGFQTQKVARLDEWVGRTERRRELPYQRNSDQATELESRFLHLPGGSTTAGSTFYARSLPHKHGDKETPTDSGYNRLKSGTKSRWLITTCGHPLERSQSDSLRSTLAAFSPDKPWLRYGASVPLTQDAPVMLWDSHSPALLSAACPNGEHPGSETVNPPDDQPRSSCRAPMIALTTGPSAVP